MREIIDKKSIENNLNQSKMEIKILKYKKEAEELKKKLNEKQGENIKTEITTNDDKDNTNKKESKKEILKALDMLKSIRFMEKDSQTTLNVNERDAHPSKHEIIQKVNKIMEIIPYELDVLKELNQSAKSYVKSLVKKNRNDKSFMNVFKDLKILNK